MQSFSDSRPREGVERATASLRGSLAVAANRGVGRLRLWLHGESGLAREIQVEGGAYAIEELAPGTYRVELRASRLVFARRVTLRAGDELTVDFSLR